MKGYLFRVSGKTERLKRRWCVLSNEGILSLHTNDDAGQEDDTSVYKGRLSLAGCTVSVSDNVNCQFEIRHPEIERAVIFRAPTANELSGKLNAQMPHSINILVLYMITDWVNKLRRLAPTAAPLSMDDGDLFPPTQEISPANSRKSLHSPTHIPFEVVLEKTPDSGFGLVIESTGGGILVKERGEGVSVLSIMPESVGTVQAGDRLLKINDQDVSVLSISSIVEMIGDENMPVSSTASFSLSRKLKSRVVRPLGEPASFAQSMFSKSNNCFSVPTTPREAMPSPRELFAQYNVLECGICTESFEESGDLCPHVLSCGHSFCHKDLKRLLLVSADSFRCPTCLRRSKRSQYDDSFPPKNYSMLEAISFEYQSLEDIDVRGKAHTPEEGGCSGCGEQNLLVHCFDCKADFCSTCNITIHQPVKFKAHRRGAVEAREVVKTLCPVHNEKLKVYCFSPSCRTPICVLCTTIGTHKSHDYRPIRDVFVAEKQEFKEKLQEEAGLLSELSAMHEQKRAAVDALNQSRVQAASAIEDDFREARRRLDSLEQDALDALNVHVDERLEPLKADVARISDLQFMSHYAEANARMKKTSAMAGALLEEFGSESEGGPTSVELVGRAAGGIVVDCCGYSFAEVHQSLQCRSSNKITPYCLDSAPGSSGSLGTSEEATDVPR